jgi:anti-sigma regulatory factor (Ser/Thr protein kinase)
MHATLADVIADTAQNAIEAGARHITLSLTEDGKTIAVKITDDGKGMDEATQARAFNPFYTEPGKHDKRKIGMGLPFVKQTCDACGGTVALESEKGVGTTLVCTFQADNIDLPPMGNLASAALSLFTFDGDFELVFRHRRGGEEYEISRSELREAVGGFDSVEGLSLSREFLESQESSLP